MMELVHHTMSTKSKHQNVIHGWPSLIVIDTGKSVWNTPATAKKKESQSTALMPAKMGPIMGPTTDLFCQKVKLSMDLES